MIDRVSVTLDTLFTGGKNSKWLHNFSRVQTIWNLPRESDNKPTESDNSAALAKCYFEESKTNIDNQSHAIAEQSEEHSTRPIFRLRASNLQIDGKPNIQLVLPAFLPRLSIQTWVDECGKYPIPVYCFIIK